MTKTYKTIHPSNPRKYACFAESDGTNYCTFNDFKTIYFDHRIRGGQKETIVDVPWYMPTELYLNFKTRGKVVMRDGKPPYSGPDSDFQELINQEKCFVGE